MMSRWTVSLLFLILGGQPAAAASAYDCQFDWLVNGSVEGNEAEWTIGLVDIDHQMRIVFDADDPQRARIVGEFDAVNASVVLREGMVQIIEEAGDAVVAATTIFVLRDIDGAHPAVHTSQHIHDPGFGTAQVYGTCTPQP